MSELEKLTALSARIGRDPLLIQGAGGNTSYKDDAGWMWIKASGTWLSEANERDIFVPVEIAPLLRALEEGDSRADNGVAFVDEKRNPSGLRPSIETSVHAVLEHKAVVHVHSIDTIAHAIIKDAEDSLAKKLSGLDWVFVPYIRPGVPLSREIAKRIKPTTNVVVLGNHGLIVGGQNVDEAEALLNEVSKRLQLTPVKNTPDISKLEKLSDDVYQPAEGDESHQIALDKLATKRAAQGSLYPDHVIFLGVGAKIYNGEKTDAPIQIVEGAGVLQRRDLNDGAKALMRALSDVLSRIPDDAELNYLTFDQNAELLDWDAEKYRQMLNKEREK